MSRHWQYNRWSIHAYEKLKHLKKHSRRLKDSFLSRGPSTMLHRVAYLPHIFDLQFLFHRLCVTINMQINIYLEMLLLNTSFLLSQTVPLRASWLLFKTYLFYGVYQFSNLKLTSHKIILSRTLKLINHMQPHTEQYQRIQCVMAYFYKTSFQIRQFTSC